VPSLSARLDDFGSALLDPALAMPEGLLGPDGEPSVRRFSVYRNNLVVGLSEALRSGFPCVARLVGDEFFAAMARVFVAMKPPTSPILLHYGAEFPDFVQSFPPAASVPYLADVARIERAATEAYDARDATRLAPAELAAVPNEEAAFLRLRLHPSLRVLHSEYPAFTIWKMNAADGTPGPLELSRSEDTLVLRADAEVDVRHVSRGSGEFLRALGSGLTLSQATANALDADALFDLSENLQVLMQIGALVGFDQGSEGES
jgi:hypothetical protein